MYEILLAERLKELRTARGWSQVELAKRLGEAMQSVSNWENDNIQPSVEMMVKIARVFSVGADFLLGLDSRKYIEITGLSSRQIAHIQQIIDDILESDCKIGRQGSEKAT